MDMWMLDLLGNTMIFLMFILLLFIVLAVVVGIPYAIYHDIFNTPEAKEKRYNKKKNKLLLKEVKRNIYNTLERR